MTVVMNARVFRLDFQSGELRYALASAERSLSNLYKQTPDQLPSSPSLIPDATF